MCQLAHWGARRVGLLQRARRMGTPARPGPADQFSHFRDGQECPSYDQINVACSGVDFLGSADYDAVTTGDERDKTSRGGERNRRSDATEQGWAGGSAAKRSRVVTDSWNTELYRQKHSFVWELGSSLLELLAPRAGERILDLGCGTGQLTAQIARSGAQVVGLDHSPAMVEEARRLHPDLCFRKADAHDFAVDEPVDAVFSNAVLHWVAEPDRVCGRIAEALKPRGRLAAEFGGRGNVRLLADALQTASQAVLGKPVPHQWYFPSVGEFALLLERYGLEVVQAALIDRPTPLAGNDGLRNWVRMFGGQWLSQIPAEAQDVFLEQVETIARPLLHREGTWLADYRRLRVLAVKV